MGEPEAYCVNVRECGSYTSDPSNSWMCDDCINEIKSERDALKLLLKSLIEADDNEDTRAWSEAKKAARLAIEGGKPDGE